MLLALLDHGRDIVGGDTAADPAIRVAGRHLAEDVPDGWHDVLSVDAVVEVGVAALRQNRVHRDRILVVGGSHIALPGIDDDGVIDGAGECSFGNDGQVPGSAWKDLGDGAFDGTADDGAFG